MTDKKILKSAINSEEFTNLINEAAPLKVKIRTDLKDNMRENCRDFLKEVVNSDPKIRAIFDKKSSDRTPEEEEILKTWQKTQKKIFKSVTKILAPKPNTDPLKSIVEKLTQITQFARYLGNTDLEDRLANFGIKLDVKNLEDEYSYFADKDVKTVIQDIFSQSKETQNLIHENNSEIKDRIYSELDETVRYSKDNPSGIKASQFSKLVNTKAISMLKSEEEYSKYKEKLLKKESADIESREIVLEKNRTI